MVMVMKQQSWATISSLNASSDRNLICKEAVKVLYHIQETLPSKLQMLLSLKVKINHHPVI